MDEASILREAGDTIGIFSSSVRFIPWLLPNITHPFDLKAVSNLPETGGSVGTGEMSTPMVISNFNILSYTNERPIDLLQITFPSSHRPTVYSIKGDVPVSADLIQHQSGIPISEIEPRNGYRTRRRYRCRPKKTNQIPNTGVDTRPTSAM